MRAELGVDHDELLFMTVANLRPEKGYDVLLDAARAIADRGLPIRIAAVGRGPLSDRPPRTSRRTGARATGSSSSASATTCCELLAGADAFVLASLHEGLPVTLMEATSVGLPIVAISGRRHPPDPGRRGRRPPGAAGRPGRPGRRP